MHTLILGMTESGKSTLAKMLAQTLQKSGKTVVVLDPLSDRWAAKHVFDTPAELSEFMSKNRACHVFIDESGQVFDEGRNSEFAWIVTRSRHLGHSVYLIGQRAIQIPKTMRDQTSKLYLFTSSVSDGKILADEFNRPELARCASLPQFQFFEVSRFGKAEKRIVRPGKGVFQLSQSDDED
jgi:energy-coupling factor transporter ATP-binding protein EcfA2